MNPRPRRAGPLWVWVLGLLALIVLVWILVGRSGGAAAAEPGGARPPAGLAVSVSGPGHAFGFAAVGAAAGPAESIGARARAGRTYYIGGDPV